MRQFIFAAAAGLGIFGASPAFAQDPPPYPLPAPSCEYKKVYVTEYVTVYETRTVSYTKAVTQYDYCGKPYVTYVTAYKNIQVPVQKAVTVTKWVKVGY